ncbi:uncharacterized protein LOC143628158 [Bidens hawaiensis]|uniref:uncharacterized protein LOC143628158 n=1 Tax=Bidens hawaiensis TaxID=980011 RepID=UPI004048F96A
MAAAVEALKMGLKKDSPLYDDLVMTPCRNLDEVRNRALRYIRLEDDKKAHGNLIIPKYESTNRKSDFPQKFSRPKPYSKQDSPRINAVEEYEDDVEYPKFFDNIDISGVICSMHDLGDKARWPKKNENSGSSKDKPKWCAYHKDFGHHTDDCIALRKEIGCLLSKGYLKELFGKNKNKNQDPAKIPERAASPPLGAKVIAFISGGSDICGTSYSAAKKRARETNMDNGSRPLRTSTLTTQRTTSFEEEDRCDLENPHHDDFVITLSIAKCFVCGILIDGKSSVNNIQLDALKKMDISESEIIPRSSLLVGLSGETKNTLGDIKLLVT